MALKIKFAKPTGKHPVGIAGCCAWRCWRLRSRGAGRALSSSAIYYVKYQGIVDERLKQPLFANTAKIYAAPREVRPGQKLTVQLIANELREAGYTDDGAAQASPLGTYQRGRADRSPCIPARSRITRRTAQPSTSAAAWCSRSPTITGRRCRATSWSRCSSPG